MKSTVTYIFFLISVIFSGGPELQQCIKETPAGEAPGW
jgi:hypothetical protein